MLTAVISYHSSTISGVIPVSGTVSNVEEQGPVEQVAIVIPGPVGEGTALDLAAVEPRFGVPPEGQACPP